MAKKKIKHKKVQRLRNAAPAAPRAIAPRAPRARSQAAGNTSIARLGWTAAGAGATALVGSFLAREGWAPKTIAGVMSVAGGVASATSHDEKVRDVGSGAMSAAGSQFLLLMLDDHEHQKATATAVAAN